MSTISLCMIVKNEEDVLERCLNSVKDLVDEIIIIDTGSVDGTKGIALRYTDKVYDFRWIDDFSAARNFAFDKATMEYQMWLDADDIIEAQECEKFLEMKKCLSEGETDIVFMRYNMGFDGSGNPTLSYYRERIFRRAMNYRWSGAVHETIVPYGKVAHYELAVSHHKMKVGDKDRNIRIYENLLTRSELSPRDMFYYGRELMYHNRYTEAIEWLERFLIDGKGWREDNVEACLNLSYCCGALGDSEKAGEWLYRSFTYDIPHAEVLCKIGYRFKEKGEYKAAYFWFKAATELDIKDRSGFTNPDCYGFIPYMELCVCSDRLGNRSKAIFYHEKAKSIKPKDPSVIYNDNFFYNKK